MTLRAWIITLRGRIREALVPELQELRDRLAKEVTFNNRLCQNIEQANVNAGEWRAELAAMTQRAEKAEFELVEQVRCFREEAAGEQVVFDTIVAERDAMDQLRRAAVARADGIQRLLDLSDAACQKAEAERDALKQRLQLHDACNGVMGERGYVPECISLRAERDALRAQLPEGMKDCTITFSQCERGHGHLSATNWVQYPCMVCERDTLREALKTAYEMATDPSRDESEFDWAIFCEMLYRALKEPK